MDGKGQPIDPRRCDPMSELGPNSEELSVSNVFRVTPESGHRAVQLACLRMGQQRTHTVWRLPLHSSTVSARTRTVSGMLMPRAFAVLRFTTKSNLAGRSMGRSAGLVPPKMRPT
jgi:hypothetical protein